MRTTVERDDEDLTRRAQIIDAAILTFAQLGDKASVRAIAAQAGVSPGLITHHFGSKESLKEECDRRVLNQYVELKLSGVANPLGTINDVLTDQKAVSVITAYILRTIMAGGPPAAKFMELMTEQMRTIMDKAAQAGLVKPSHNEEARLDFLASAAFGAALIRFILDPPDDVTKTASQGVLAPDLMLAELEVFTDGVFTDRTILDAVTARLDANN